MDKQAAALSNTNLQETGARLVVITIGIMLATLMQTLDTTIVNVALPIVQGNLGATTSEGAWVITGYIVAAVIVIPLTPWLQRRCGRRAYYAAGIAGFTLASIGCALSTSIWMLVFWRVVQGLFGGGLVATGQAALNDVFGPERLGVSQGLFAIGAIAGPCFGPTLGGWLTDNFSWNYIFYINLVPGILATAIVLAYMRNPQGEPPGEFDTLGLVSLIVGLGALQYVLEQGERNDWFSDTSIVAGSIAAVAGIVTFVAWELHVKSPIVDLSVFRYRAMGSGFVIALAAGASLYGALVILPQYVQGVLGFTATLSGELIFVRAVCIGLFTPVAAALVMRGADARWIIGGGLVMLGMSQQMQGSVTTPVTDFSALVPSMILGGIGIAFVMIPLSIAIMGGVPESEGPKASSLFALAIQLGGSISTALLVTLLDHRIAVRLSDLAGTVALSRPGIAGAIAHHAPLAQFFGEVQLQAAALGFADVNNLLGIMIFCLIPLVLVMPRPEPGRKIELAAA